MKSFTFRLSCIFSFVLFALSLTTANAQATYVGNYFPNAGNPGSIYNLSSDAPGTTGWTSCGLAALLSANAWSPAISLPFSFNFYGAPVTQFKVSANGLLTFDVSVTGTPPNSNENLPSATLPNNTICVMWDAFTNTPPIGPNDVVYYRVFGSAPNRQFWVYWYSYEIGAPSVSFTYMAAVLEESSNKIYIVDTYGNATPALTTTVGVQLNSTTATQFGSNNIAQAGNGIGISDNDYWEFQPLFMTPCAGAPTVPAITASVPFVSNTTTNVNLAFSNTLPLLSSTGLSYQWQSSLDGITYTNIAGANGLTLSTTIAATTYFQCAVTCANGGAVTNSNAVQVEYAFAPSISTNSITAPSCSSAIAHTISAEILVGSGSFSVPSCPYTFNLTDDYADGWNGATMQILDGSTVVATLGSSFTGGGSSIQSVVLQNGGSYSLFWNNGGDYPEEVGLSVVNPSGTSIFTLPYNSTSSVGTSLFTISASCPSNAITFSYTTNGGVTNNNIPMTNTSGNTYTAEIPAATPSNAVVSWTISATNSYALTTTLDSSYQDNSNLGVNLAASASPNIVCVNGQTQLSAIALTSTQSTLINAENFEAGISAYTLVSTGSGSPLLAVNTTYFSEGLQSMRLSAGNNANASATLVSSMDLSQVAGATLEFDHICASEANYDYGIVEYSSDGGLNWTPFPVSSYLGQGTLYQNVVAFTRASYAGWPTTSSQVPDNSMWKHETISIPSIALTNGFKVRFRYTSDGSSNYYGWLIDQVQVKAALPQNFDYTWYSSNNTQLGTGLLFSHLITSTDSFYCEAASTFAPSCVTTSVPVTVTALDLPATPIATNSTQCGTGIPIASVASAAGAAGTGDYLWYDAATNGNLVQNSSWLTQYQDNFAGPSVAANGLLTGVANLTATPGWLQITPNTNSQQGGLTVQPGVNGIEYKIDFDFKSNTTFGADGFSWSFAPDADATLSIGSSKAESGTGSKLKISFDSYGTTMPNQKGTYVVYNNTDTTFTNTSTGVLAHTANTPWLSTTSKHITITISQAGVLNMSVDGIAVFTNIALPASYLTEDKATWKHVFAARTGGVNMKNEIDNLLIQYKLTSVGSTTFNSSLSSGVTYYVTELGTNGCSSQLAPVVIGVSQPTPIDFVNSATGICFGESVTLNMSSTITPAYSYTISSPNSGAGVGSSATGATQTFTPTAAGSMPYIVTATNGNCTEVDTVNIMVNNFIPAAPIAVDSLINICAGVTSQSVAVTPSISAPSILTWSRTGLSKLISSTLLDTKDTITVGTLPLGATVTGLSIGVNLTHTFNGDIDMYLIGPNGTEIELSTDNGDGGDNYTNTVFSTNATTLITAGTSPFTGTFLPEGNLSQFLSATTGQWILKIIDDAGGDDGVLLNWDVNVQYAMPAAITWYASSTSTTPIGSIASIEAIGTPVMSAPAALGTYTFFAAAQDNVPGGCLSATRTPVTIDVVSVLAEIIPIDASCNSVANGSFSLGTISCGTAPFTYSVDGGAFGAIPTNLAYGSHTVVVKDATGALAPSKSIFIDQPTWITNVPNFVANGFACKDETSEVISAANPNLNQTQTISLGSVNIGANGVATLNPALNLPIGAVVTSATLQLNGMTTSGGTWANDLTVVASGLGTTNQVPTGQTVTNSNYSYPLSSINPNGTSINVVITNTWISGNAIINNVSLVVNYTINQTLSNITWYATPTGGSALGTGFTLESVGTSVLPNTLTPGTYNFYAQGELDGCSSFTRLLVPVTIQAPTVVANMQTATVCPGQFLTLNATGGLTYNWSNGAGQNTPFVPAPTSYVGATQSYVVNGFDVDGCASQDTVVVTVLPQPILNGGVDQSICAGTPVILNAATTAATATPVTSFVWSNNVVNNTQYVPTVTGPITVTAAGANGCTTQDQVIITVLALPMVNAGADQIVCLGMGTSLVATGAVSYAWNNGATQFATFYPTATQTYTVVGTGANGCTNNDQVIVNIQTLPQVVATSSTQVCSNAPAALNAAVQNSLGGYWTTNNGLGVISPNVSNANATYTPNTNDPTVVNFTYIANNACGSSAQNTTVAILAIPSVNAGADFAVCQGASATVNATGTGFLTWTTPNVANGVAFVPVTTTTYNVVATGANNCTNNDQLTITVLSLPDVDAGMNQTVCSGESVTLAAQGASAYQWSGSVVNNTAFVPATTATYTVTGTGSNGCSSADQVTVTVNTTPAASIAVVDNTTLVATPAGMNYQWINCVSGTDVPNASMAMFTAIVNGSYAVIVTSAEGCSDQSSCEIIDAVGLDQLTKIEMTVQPNPTSGDLSISMPTDLTAQAEVFDAQGKLVLSEPKIENGSVLHLESMTTGVYMIRISSDNTIQTFRVVKQ